MWRFFLKHVFFNGTVFANSFYFSLFIFLALSIISYFAEFIFVSKTSNKLSKSFKKMDEHLESLKARERTDEADLYFRQAKLMREEYLQTRNNFLKWSQRQSQQPPQPAESQ